MRTLLALALVLTLAFTLASGRVTDAAVEDTVWVTLDTNGNQFPAGSGSFTYPPAVSADGRYVAFETLSTLTHDGDNNSVEDVFVRDTGRASSGDDDPGERARTTLVSVAKGEEYSNNRSYAPDMSSDASLVVFESLASNLVENDNNGASDIFVRDIGAGTTTRISTAPGEADADAPSYRPSISADGAFVAFCSRATNLADGDTNNTADVFLFERATGALTRLAIDGTGGASEGCVSTTLSDDGGVLAYSAVVGSRSDVFVADRGASSVSITGHADGSSGMSGVSLSGDGNIVAYDSVATNLVGDDSNRSRDVFVFDRSAGEATRVSVRTDESQLPGDSGTSGVALSGDGHFVVFDSAARGVLPGDSNGRQDVYRRDITNGETTLASANVYDSVPNDSSYSPTVTPDGSIVAYTSIAGNIVFGDTNRQPDVFLRKGNFPALSDTSGPQDTGAPDESDPLAPIPTTEDDGIPKLYVAGGIAGAAVLALVVLSLLLGRRGKA